LLKKIVDRQLNDPKDKPIEEAKEIKDEIERRVMKLLSEIEK
jgi:hypothetical protein